MKNFLELLKSRHSCRRFTDEAVSKESIEYILEAEVENPVDIENIRLALKQYNTEVEDYDLLVLQYYIFAKNLIESHI